MALKVKGHRNSADKMVKITCRISDTKGELENCLLKLYLWVSHAFWGKHRKV